MDSHITKWKDELLRRGYGEKRVDFSIPWYERKWFSIDGHDSSILQIWNAQVYRRIVYSIHGTIAKPYTYGCYIAVINPEGSKSQWWRDGYRCEYRSAEEIWKLL